MNISSQHGRRTPRIRSLRLVGYLLRSPPVHADENLPVVHLDCPTITRRIDVFKKCPILF